MKGTIFFLVFLFFTASLFASRTEFSTDQICKIEGIIQSVDYEEAFRDACLDDNNCPIGAYNPNRPARYYLKILLSAVSCDPDKNDDINAYVNQLPLGKEVEIYIDKNKIRNENFFKSGQKIKGQVKYFFGNSFISYELEQ